MVLGRYHKLCTGGVMREVNDSCYYIPLLESLQSLLSIESVRDQVHNVEPINNNKNNVEHKIMQVLNSHKMNEGKMGDYCDGEQYRTHSLFQEDPCAIQLRLYYDDLEVCNALGSKTKKHKLGMHI